MGRLSCVEIILLTKVTNLHAGAGREETVDFPNQKCSCYFPPIYSMHLKEAKLIFFSNEIIKDIFLRWER